MNFVIAFLLLNYLPTRILCVLAADFRSDHIAPTRMRSILAANSHTGY